MFDLKPIFSKSLSSRVNLSYLYTHFSARDDVIVHGIGSAQTNTICVVLSGNTLDDQAKARILLVTKDVVNLQDQRADSRVEGAKRDWLALHLGVWNRYAWTVRHFSYHHYTQLIPSFIITGSKPSRQ